MTHPTDALIDLGMVLYTFDFEAALMRLVPPGTPDASQRITSLLARKDEFETGRINRDDYVAWASEQLGFQGPAEAFCDTWNSIFAPNPPMWNALLAAQQRGLRLILFSNTNSIHGPWFLENEPFLKNFEEIIFSYDVGAIKPHPDIYHHAIETFQLTPRNTLYVDDLPANIATGRALGFRSHEYNHRNHEAFEAWFASQFPS